MTGVRPAGERIQSEFLVRIEIRTPSEMDDATVDDLRAKEAAQARMLAERGYLVRLWRIPGRWGNWGYWRAESVDALNELLSSLPLYPFMTVEVHPLDPHPSDPVRPEQAATQRVTSRNRES